MRITILTGPFSSIPPYSIGAVEKLWYLVGGLLSDNNNVVFVSKKVGDAKGDNRAIYIKGYERSGSWLKDFLLDFIYSLRALKAAPKSDIIILNSIWSPILFPLFKKKLHHALYNVARFPKKQLKYYSKVDCLACVSTAVYKAAISQSPQISNITCVIPNPVNTLIYNREFPKECSASPIVVYSGRVHREKGLEILVKAIDCLNKGGLPVGLYVIGARDIANGGSGAAYIDDLNSLAESFDIKWIDPIYEPERLANEMDKGDIFCYPSIAEKGETFGVAPLEAMGLGLPTIVSDLDCFKDFVEDGKNGFVFDHKDKDSHLLVAEIISRLISDTLLYKSVSFGGIETSRRFSVENIASMYYERIKDIVKDGTSGDEE